MMLIPKQRIYNDSSEGEFNCTVKYFVYDNEECGYLENHFFTHYDTKEDCQKAIDLFNSFNIVRV